MKSGNFGVLDWPDDPGDTPAQADHWLKMSSGWLRIHTVPRKRMFTPEHVDGGPSELTDLQSKRVTQIFRWATSHCH